MPASSQQAGGEDEQHQQLHQLAEQVKALEQTMMEEQIRLRAKAEDQAAARPPPAPTIEEDVERAIAQAAAGLPLPVPVPLPPSTWQLLCGRSAGHADRLRWTRPTGPWAVRLLLKQHSFLCIFTSMQDDGPPSDCTNSMNFRRPNQPPPPAAGR